MKKKKILLLVILPIVIAIVAGAGIIHYFKVYHISYNAVQKYPDDYSEKMGNFTAKTAEGILKGKKKNTCYSPASLYSVLCMSAELMNDETSQEIISALNYRKQSAMENGYKYMLKKLGTNSNEPSVNMSNAVWLKEEIVSDEAQEKIDYCMEKIQCEIYRKDFTAEDINSWVSEKTKGMIENIVNDISPVVITNAVYYKSEWRIEFKDTENGDFTLASGEKINIDYMENTEETKYVKGKNYIATKRDFMDDGEIIFILPDKSKDIDDIMSEEIINEILASFTSKNYDRAEVTLKMPMFDYATSISESDIQSVLKNIGIGKIFNSNAWDTLIKDNVDSTVMAQKTRIIVNKKGVEAAGATSSQPQVIGIFDKEELRKIEITLNKPFMYIIVKNDTPLFIGTVYNPNEN